MKKKGFHRWNWRGGSNPTNLEKRAKDAMSLDSLDIPVKVYTAAEIDEYEKEAKVGKYATPTDSQS